jgi:signal transduction histidine kinase
MDMKYVVEAKQIFFFVSIYLIVGYFVRNSYYRKLKELIANTQDDVVTAMPIEKRLLIQDSGIGIKPEDIQRVFEKGFTGSSGRSFAKSTGMGLYLAWQLAIKLSHRLSIQSEEGKYTKLIIHFPKIRNHFYI